MKFPACKFDIEGHGFDESNFDEGIPSGYFMSCGEESEEKFGYFMNSVETFGYFMNPV